MRLLIYFLIVLYILSPYDLFPDFFIGGGWIDDLLVLALLGWYHFIYKRRPPRGREGAYGYRHSSGSGEEASEKREASGLGESEGDPYEILGVGRNASPEEIRTAYRRLVNQYHPDRVTHLGEEFRVLAEKKFKEIQQAYQKLKDHGH